MFGVRLKINQNKRVKGFFSAQLTRVAMIVRLCSNLLVLCLRFAAANMPNDEAAKFERAFSRELRELELKQYRIYLLNNFLKPKIISSIDLLVDLIHKAYLTDTIGTLISYLPYIFLKFFL